MKPDLPHLEHLGISRRVATNLALILQAAAGKTVISFSTRMAYADTEFRAVRELLHALGLEANVRPLDVAFKSGGRLMFVGADYARNLDGLRPDIVDGIHLLPVYADIWRAEGVETW